MLKMPLCSIRFSVLLLVALTTTTVTWQGSSAMSLGRLGPLFPRFELATAASPRRDVVCVKEDLRLLCQTCPSHRPVCTLDLQGCSWLCSPQDPATRPNMLH